MKELDEWMNVIMSDIVGNSRLPKIEIEEPDADMDYRVNCRKGSDVCTINPNTFNGLRKLTQLMGVASLIYRLIQGSVLMQMRNIQNTLVPDENARGKYNASERSILLFEALIRIARCMR